MSDGQRADVSVVEDPAAEPVHFPSYRERGEPVRDWFVRHLGPAVANGSWRHYLYEAHGVRVRAILYETHVEWGVGFNGTGQKVGTTAYAGWEKKVPPAVWLAVAHIRLLAELALTRSTECGAS